MSSVRLRALAAATLAAVLGCTPEDGPSMRPGSDCLECHGNPGAEESGPTWTLAGTVYASAQGSGDGVRGAAIHVVDAGGRAVTLHSNSVGNFYLADALRFPLQVSVERNDATHVMSDSVDEGGCNRCHHAGSAAGSIAAP
jgi:hypothetical protein